MKPQVKNTLIISMFAAFGTLAACGGGGSGSSSTPPPPVTSAAPGVLSVGMTDAPACGFDQVNVTVSKLRVHTSSTAADTDAGWTDITLSPARKINLLSLRDGLIDKLGQTQLAAGHYTQLRLVLGANAALNPMANSVVPTGGVELALDVPSGTQSGIKLNHEFDVASDAIVDLTLDFDACKSIVSRGNSTYMLKPVISVVPMVVSGSIVGVVDPAITSGSHPLVTAQQNGVVIKAATPDAQGKFTLSPVKAGSYDVVATADGRASNIIGGVPVVARASTVVSTATSVLQLPASTTSNLSGTVLPLAIDSELTVSQSISGGPTVVIASKMASFSTGAYAFALPAAAPMVGQYGTGNLPIVLNANLAAAGKYTIQAAAPTYVTQSAAVDVSLLNVVKDFTLVH